MAETIPRMNTRRNFLKNVMIAGASFAILPGAGRIWKAERACPTSLTLEMLPFQEALQQQFAHCFFFNKPIDFARVAVTWDRVSLPDYAD